MFMTERMDDWKIKDELTVLQKCCGATKGVILSGDDGRSVMQ